MASLLFVWACKRDLPPPEAPSVVETAHFRAERVLLAHEELRGLSGLTSDGGGTVWGVPEDQRLLVPLSYFDTSSLRRPVIQLRGIPEDWDTEAIAWLSGQRFALGSERREPRDREFIFIVEIEGEEAHVRERVEVPYGPWGVTATPNRGLEGLCHVGQELFFANENVGQLAGRRFAPIGRYHFDKRALRYDRLFLTSDTGRLSSLVCRAHPAGVEVVAIERHYGVGRLLTFVWPDRSEVPIEPKLLLDLVPLFFPLPNYEGLVWRRDGTLLVLADNDTGGRTGPNEMLVLTPKRSH